MRKIDLKIGETLLVRSKGGRYAPILKLVVKKDGLINWERVD